jgi:tetratricopeptide (TPR) repeat protein
MVLLSMSRVHGVGTLARFPRGIHRSSGCLLAILMSSCLLSERLAGHGAYHDVVAGLTAELQEDPDNAALRYKLAEAHAGHEEWRSCLKEIQLVEQLAPGVYPTGFLRGLALHIAGNDEDARTTLDGFLSAHPHHVDALITRGKVWVNLGRPLDAAADFQQAVNLSPVPQPDLIADLARCHAASGNTREASKVIDAGLKAVGNDPALLRCALEIETKAAAWDAALGRIEALQKTAPRKEPWMARRAELLHQAGRSDESLAAWRALHDHLLSLPNLERGTPANLALLHQARSALGETTLKPVSASPIHSPQQP